MEKQIELETLQREIEVLEAKKKEERENYKRLKAAKNRLALLTADLFVAIFYKEDKRYETYGVSREVEKTRCEGFTLSMNRRFAGVHVNVSFVFGDGRLELILKPEQEISVNLGRDLDSDDRLIFLRVFKTQEEADNYR